MSTELTIVETLPSVEKEARERLAVSLTNLEKTVNQKIQYYKKLQSDHTPLEERIASLQASNQQLSEELARLQQRYNRLHQQSQQTVAELDQAIDALSSYATAEDRP